MLLDFQNVQFRTVIRQVSREKLKLTIDYPNTEPARRKVMSALADLIRPDAAESSLDSLSETMQPKAA